MRCIQTSSGVQVIIDDEDYEWLSQWEWYISGRYVARNADPGAETLIHRLIMNTPSHLEADHINRNPLDNRKSNLRNITRSQNAHNRSKTANRSSQYIGVGKHKSTGKWQAYIKVNRRTTHLGLYDDEKQAAIIRDTAALDAFGVYANLNFPADG